MVACPYIRVCKWLPTWLAVRLLAGCLRGCLARGWVAVWLYGFWLLCGCKCTAGCWPCGKYEVDYVGGIRLAGLAVSG